MNHKSTERPGDNAQKPVKREGWFATFTFLDVTGAIGSSHVRRLGAVITRMWKLMLQSISDRSKSRVVGV
jgi:hypothetical protein